MRKLLPMLLLVTSCASQQMSAEEIQSALVEVKLLGNGNFMISNFHGHRRIYAELRKNNEDIYGTFLVATHGAFQTDLFMNHKPLYAITIFTKNGELTHILYGKSKGKLFRARQNTYLTRDDKSAWVLDSIKDNIVVKIKPDSCEYIYPEVTSKSIDKDTVHNIQLKVLCDELEDYKQLGKDLHELLEGYITDDFKFADGSDSSIPIKFNGVEYTKTIRAASPVKVEQKLIQRKLTFVGDSLIVADNEKLITHEKVNGEWKKVSEFSASGEIVSVKGVGDILLCIGRYNSNGIIVYEKKDDSWVEVPIVFTSENTRGGVESVASEGGTLVVGFKGRQKRRQKDKRPAQKATKSSVVIFARTEDGYIEKAQLHPPEEKKKPTTKKRYSSTRLKDYSFGKMVGISGGVIAVGASEYKRNGAIFLYEKMGESWRQKGMILAPKHEGSSGLRFGSEFTMHKNRLLVGTGNYSEGSVSSGAAFMYDINAPSTWDSPTKLLPSDLGIRNWFGGNVALDGNSAYISAVGDTTTRISEGSIYHFEFKDSKWVEVEKFVAPDDSYETVSFGSKIICTPSSVYTYALQRIENEKEYFSTDYNIHIYEIMKKKQ